MLFSVLQIRFNEAYQKDDYKLAVSLLLEEKKPADKLLVAGYRYTLEYYGIGFKDSDLSQLNKNVAIAMLLQKSSEEEIANEVNSEAEPKLVLLFKKESFNYSKLSDYFKKQPDIVELVNHPDFEIYRIK